jgi:hypothetical protein
MVDRIDQHRNAEGVRQQDEFLAHQTIALVAGVSQEADAFKPFLLRQLDIADKRV